MISNVNDPHVKAVARLSERARRDDAGVFLVEGPQAVRELLRFAPDSVADLFFTAEFVERHPDIMDLAHASPAVLDEVTPKVLDTMADTVTPQGVVAVARALSHSLAELASVTLVAICHEIRDPGNAGTLIRAADAAGADAVVFTGNSVDLHNPKLVRSSTGSIFHLPVVEHRSLDEVVAHLRSKGARIVATDVDGEPINRISAQLELPTAWLFGNEASGLDADARALSDSVVAVPIFGNAESLNLATAASVCLYLSAFALHS